MSLLSLDKVSKSFGALKVAQKITFDLSAGEALGIIGPNGAGKSTLFNLITGNVPVDAGRIVFDGEDMTHAPPMSRCLAGLGRTFQIPQPFETLTVFENLVVAAAFGSLRAEADVTDHCANILMQTGLVERANEPAGRLSLLARKRLELARALATEPKLLLLDEIAGGLTDAECGELIGTIRAIRSAGISIIWIEHVLHALNSVVERIVVLDFGKVIGIGSPEEIMGSDEVKEIYLGIEV
jgi:branched-chain amino acid transport system ATP-binding protein